MTAPPRLSWTDVRDVIRARILSRDYGLGARLPRDADIAQELGCTRTTVHRAMQDLATSGLIERRRKGGTHVKADPVARATFDIPLTRREVEDRGCVYSHRLISRHQTNSPATVMAALGQVLARPMLHVVALHLADDRPYLLEDRWIDLASCPEILDVDLSRISANEWLVRHKPYTRLEVRFSAINAQGDVAQHLACTPGQAVLVVARRTWMNTAPITAVQAIAAPHYQLAASS